MPIWYIIVKDQQGKACYGVFKPPKYRVDTVTRIKSLNKCWKKLTWYFGTPQSSTASLTGHPLVFFYIYSVKYCKIFIIHTLGVSFCRLYKGSTMLRLYIVRLGLYSSFSHRSKLVKSLELVEHGGLSRAGYCCDFQMSLRRTIWINKLWIWILTRL